MIDKMKRPQTKSGMIVFIIGMLLTAVSEIFLMTSMQAYPREFGLFGLMIGGFIIMIIGLLQNRQFYVDNYNEMNPRDIIRNH